MATVMLDRLGWAYIGIVIGWTVALTGGMLFLYKHRQVPCVRIRRLPILFVGVILLHVYGSICLVGYILVPVFPCAAEFWVMSIYLPFGMAMFQAANSQFLYIASRQKQYVHLGALSDHGSLRQEQVQLSSQSRWGRLFRGTDGANKVDRMLVYIGLGLVVQVLLTFLIFFGSRKFHPGYGLWDLTVEGTSMEARMNCSKGWEWWLSIVWQFYWVWIYAPYQLWISRSIRDVHGWRLQTICCCLAGLPATPLWLTGLYAPQMAPVNAKFVPPSWFSACIALMEIITIGFPIAQVFKSRTLRQETLDAIASWEKRQQVHNESDSTIVGSTHSSKTGTYTAQSTETNSTWRKSMDSQKSDMFTMAALENALRTNPTPLLQFAALKDFSGENVSFLTHLADWRRAWFSPKASTAEHRHRQFVAAVRVYVHFVSLEFAEFPINISSREMKNLHQIFESAAALLVRNKSVSSSSDSATPFDNIYDDSDSTVELRSGANLHALGRANLESVSQMIELVQEEALVDVPIPEAFTETVFGPAENEIKYLILTNTWPKFVNAGCDMREQIVEKEAQTPGWLRKTVLCSA
ncbi:hypothetical protein K458DRAFT_474311 [Lentithecium fluviatile CBS 122367]|uniref:RGS domain-containing protein n=1 Tax=Lentithecium fluviatile CBS 122367 TaxID=1168545 RepID=A0A6G1JID4_9PLEO|nr:hypothetical protein K458DRAFT_474311 [Lentithecium fluviatile CBS 122367]